MRRLYPGLRSAFALATLLVAIPALAQYYTVTPELKARAAKGDFEAIEELGWAYHLVGQDREAIALLTRAIETNPPFDKSPMMTLANIYFTGPTRHSVGPILNPLCSPDANWGEEGMKYLLDRSKAGDSEAMLILADNYRRSDCGKDPSQAAAWFMNAAQMGRIQAKASLAEMYARGEGVSRDVAKARYWTTAALDQAKGRLGRAGPWLTLYAPDGQIATMLCEPATTHEDTPVGCPKGAK